MTRTPGERIALLRYLRDREPNDPYQLHTLQLGELTEPSRGRKERKMTTHEDLKLRWHTLASRFCDSEERIGAAWDAIVEAYSNPVRAYHNLDHVRDCLDRMRGMGISYSEMQLALWFHDAVYVAGRDDNELKSAKLMEDWAVALDFPTEYIDEAWRLIMVTARHHEAHTRFEKIVADIDLWCLASAPEDYLATCLQIRDEFSQFSDSEFYEGRAKWLRSMLDQSRIYKSWWADQEGLEERARDNMETELAAIGVCQ